MKTALLGHFNFKWFMSTVYSPVLILPNQLEGKTLRGSAKTPSNFNNAVLCLHVPYREYFSTRR